MIIWKAWSNGSGTYGLKINTSDRDNFFNKNWEIIILELPSNDDFQQIEVKVSNSFWRKCPELRSCKIKDWFRSLGWLPWEKGKPPRFEIEHITENRFRLLRKID